MNRKIGRNDPCFCGSGKKYKNCCMNKKEEVAKYTPQGKRKFKAKVLNVDTSGINVFGKTGQPGQEATQSDILQRMKFSVTSRDFRKKADEKPIHFSSSEKDPEEVKKLDLPDEFKKTKEDFREKT